MRDNDDMVTFPDKSEALGSVHDTVAVVWSNFYSFNDIFRTIVNGWWCRVNLIEQNKKRYALKCDF